MTDEQQRVRKRVIYGGRVQGVGFRYTTASIAKRFPVVGYVKNLRDGSVELVVEAASESLDAFLEEVASTFHGHISDCVTHECESQEDFSVFEIRFR